ncbi:hypothetical protein QFZ76_004095 [Streptomyces sp. V4I2]|nr:hypothetical protein [Streptomyces sp. V4I2]
MRYTTRGIRLAAALVEAADTLTDGFETTPHLQRMSDHCVELLSARTAGVMLIDGGEAVSLAGSNRHQEVALDLLEAQYGGGHAPARQAAPAVAGPGRGRGHRRARGRRRTAPGGGGAARRTVVETAYPSRRTRHHQHGSRRATGRDLASHGLWAPAHIRSRVFSYGPGPRPRVHLLRGFQASRAGAGLLPQPVRARSRTSPVGGFGGSGSPTGPGATDFCSGPPAPHEEDQRAAEQQCGRRPSRRPRAGCRCRRCRRGSRCRRRRNRCGSGVGAGVPGH